MLEHFKIVWKARKNKTTLPETVLFETLFFSQNPLIMFDSHQNVWFKYTHNLWKCVTNAEIRHYVWDFYFNHSFLCDQYTAPTDKAVCGVIHSLSANWQVQNDWDTYQHLVPFEDSILNTNTLQLEAHTPNVYNRYVVQYEVAEAYTLIKNHFNDPQIVEMTQMDISQFKSSLVDPKTLQVNEKVTDEQLDTMFCYEKRLMGGYEICHNSTLEVGRICTNHRWWRNWV